MGARHVREHLRAQVMKLGDGAQKQQGRASHSTPSLLCTCAYKQDSNQACHHAARDASLDVSRPIPSQYFHYERLQIEFLNSHPPLRKHAVTFEHSQGVSRVSKKLRSLSDLGVNAKPCRGGPPYRELKTFVEVSRMGPKAQPSVTPLRVIPQLGAATLHRNPASALGAPCTGGQPREKNQDSLAKAGTLNTAKPG